MTQQKTDLQKQFEQQMRDIQKQMEQFEEQARHAQDEAQTDIEKQMADLRERRKHMEAQFEEVRNAGEDVFQTLANNFEQTIKDFGSALDSVFVQNKQSATGGTTNVSDDTTTPSSTGNTDDTTSQA